jgi:hypothetical protein
MWANPKIVDLFKSRLPVAGFSKIMRFILCHPNKKILVQVDTIEEY